MKSDRTRDWSLIGLIVVSCVGVILRLNLFARRGSLWFDEAMLAVSIVERPARSLFFSPLEYKQVAPALYLQLSKFSTIAFGNSDYALRAVAILSSVLAVIAFAFLVRKQLSPAEAIVAALFFAFSRVLIRYGAEGKQYSCDLLTAVLLTGCALTLMKAGYSKKWTFISAAAGFVLVWFSDTAVFLLAGLAVGLAVSAWRSRDPRALVSASVLAPAWIIAAVAAIAASTRRSGDGVAQLMDSYWSHSFMPLPPRSVSDLLWPLFSLNEAHVSGLGLRNLHGLTLIAMAFGAWTLWRRGRQDIVILLFAPIAIVLCASAARLYPFNGRLVLFAVPAFAIALAVSIVAVASFVGRFKTFAAASIMIFILETPRWVVSGIPPTPREEIRPVLSFIASHKMPGDRVFVSWGAAPAVRFYGGRSSLTRAEEEVELNPADSVAREHQLTRLASAGRFWVVFTHPTGTEYDQTIRSAARVGVRDASMDVTAEGASAALFQNLQIRTH